MLLNIITDTESQWELPTKKASNELSEVEASHLLVKHAGSRRPSSHRQEKITRTIQEARELIEKYKQEIEDGADFAVINIINNHDNFQIY